MINLEPGEVEFFLINGLEDAFIYNINGAFTKEILADIENDFRESDDIPPKDATSVICTPVYDRGEKDTGHPPYWWFENLKYQYEEFSDEI